LTHSPKWRITFVSLPFQTEEDGKVEFRQWLCLQDVSFDWSTAVTGATTEVATVAK
jgi:hypothetical protein